jgi:deoxycytidylate deaminase
MNKSSAKKILSTVPNPTKSDSNSSNDLQKRILERRSRELVIGLCGAIGSGVKALKESLISSLETYGYKIVDIRISKIISEKTQTPLDGLSALERYNQLQDLGNSLRKTHKNSILAACAIEEIALERTLICQNEINDSSEEHNSEPSLVKTTKKIAYIIDQLKHPDEIKLLRSVYPRNFYLIGLIRTEGERKLNLEEEKISPSEIDTLIRRDRKDVTHGQQVEKSLFNADYFIHNIHNQKQMLDKSVERFIKLVHGINGISPTIDEIGMHAAYSAALRSACLSRQVGAAILDSKGNIISTGCNDVPSFGGGLYNSNSLADFRCVHTGRCSNDKHKDILKEEITDILKKSITNSLELKEIVNEITSETKIKTLIEYSRAVHAEMDSLIALARNNKETSVDKTLYVTTFPCHNCARHIVAAGIKKVVYVEPYEKSLAMKLHDDSISDNSDAKDKVCFLPFEGVSARRYEVFFQMHGDRKDDKTGKVLNINIQDSYHADSEFLDNYAEMEAKIAQSVNTLLNVPSI